MNEDFTKDVVEGLNKLSTGIKHMLIKEGDIWGSLTRAIENDLNGKHEKKSIRKGTPNILLERLRS